MSGFSIFTKFNAKDGITPVFNSMTISASSFEGRLSAASRKLKRDYGSLKDSVMSVQSAIGAIAIGSSFKMFADWEKGVLSVETLMNQSEIDKYGSKVKSLSKNAIAMGFSVEDSNKGLFDTVSALGASDKSFGVYTSSIKLAKGGITDLSIAIDGMTSVMNAYGRETVDSNRIANSFFTAQKYGKTTVEELASNIGKVAPIAKAAGVGYEELMATLAALTLGGLSTEDSATAMKGAINALIKPSKEASEVLKSLGIPVGVTALKAKGLSYALLKINEAQRKNPDLLAKAIPNIRAYTGAMALSQDKLEIIDKTLKDINYDVKNGTGLGSAYAAIANSSAASINQMLGRFKVAMITFGEAMAPVVIPILDAFTELSKKITELSPEALRFFGGLLVALTLAKPAILATKVFIDALTVATVAYGAISAGVVEAVSIAWWAGGGTICGALRAIGTNMLWTAKVGIKSLLTGMWSILSCPITWVAIGIAAAIFAIGAGLIYAYTHCENFRKIVNSVVSGISKAFDWVCEHILGVIDTLFEAWDKFWKWLTNKQETIKLSPTPVQDNLYGNQMNSFTPLSSGIGDRGGRRNNLDININNNTPFPASADGAKGGGYRMNLEGNFAQ